MNSYEMPLQGSSLRYGKKYCSLFILWCQYLYKIHLYGQMCIETNIFSLVNKTVHSFIPLCILFYIWNTLKWMENFNWFHKALEQVCFKLMSLPQPFAPLIWEWAKYPFFPWDSTRKCRTLFQDDGVMGETKQTLLVHSNWILILPVQSWSGAFHLERV